MSDIIAEPVESDPKEEPAQERHFARTTDRESALLNAASIRNSIIGAYRQARAARDHLGLYEAKSSTAFNGIFEMLYSEAEREQLTDVRKHLNDLVETLETYPDLLGLPQ